MASANTPALGATTPMGTANMSFLLDRLGQDCAPLQYLRELTQNAIQAIERVPGGKGEIVWDVDWNIHALTGRYKLSIVDTGEGMTGDEMVKYINQLSSSIHVQSASGNFGVGAKVAAAPRNPAGLIYVSWKDGIASTIHLWKDPETGEYGLRRLQRPDGSLSEWAYLEDAVKPEVIKDHGTMVILLGADDDADTMSAPDAPSPSTWIARYLNTRFFTFPKGIEIKARQGWTFPRTNKDTNLLRTLSGEKAYLDQHAASSGAVPLGNATVHWWVLKNEPALSQNSGYIASSGHVAALYKNELYEMLTARAGVARLQSFGVIFGCNQVVLYVEPKIDENNRVTPNTARTHLLLNSQPLPWDEWAAAFRDAMPQAIKDLMEEVAAGSTAPDHRQSIRERLRQIRDLFRFSRYRPTPKGKLRLGDETEPGGKPDESDRERPTGSAPSGGRGGRAGDIYALFITARGVPGEEFTLDRDQPDVTWISVTDNTRTPPDLDDRAAKFLPQQNKLLINADFRVIDDMVKRWCERYDHVPGALPTVRDVVHEWFEQQLIETVLGVQALQGSQHWTLDDLQSAWSEQALTAAVMPRYHIDNNVKRALGAKLGTLKDRVA